MTRFFGKLGAALMAGLFALFLLVPQAFAQTGSWMVVNSPAVAGGQLNGVAAASANDIWAVGSVAAANCCTSTTLAEHWNGTTWSTVPTPSAGQSYNMLQGVTAPSTSNVWAVGRSDQGTLIEHWNGTAWSLVSSPNPASGPGALASISATSASDIWAVGYDASFNALIEHFNGTAWSIVPAPSGALLLGGVTALASNNAWAVGHDTILHWNGSVWSNVPAPKVDYDGDPFALSAITALSANDIWAVGTAFTTNADYDEVDEPLTEHWNGTAWSVVSAFPPVLGASAEFSGVAATASNDVWAVGGSAGSLIEQFTGQFWNVVASPQANNLQAVTTVAGNVWAVGSIQDQPVIEECQGC